MSTVSSGMSSETGTSRKAARNRKGRGKAKPAPGSVDGARPKWAVQSQIQYEAMAASGLAWLGGKDYSITLRLSDIDYQLLDDGARAELADAYAAFLSGHLSSHHVQVSVVNRVLDAESLMEGVRLGQAGDGHDGLRAEYDALIAKRLASGRRNVITEKYLTLRVQADSPEDAAAALARIASEDAAALRRVGGCQIEQLDGQARVRLLQRFWRPNNPGDFDYGQLEGQAATTKDFVAPMALDTSTKGHLELSGAGTALWKTMVLRKLPPFLTDTFLSSISELAMDVAVSVHIDPISQGDGVRMVEQHIAAIDMERESQLKTLGKQGLPSDFLPSSLSDAHDEATQLREALTGSNEKLFETTIVVGVGAASEAELAANAERVRQAAESISCVLEDLNFMQVDAFNALTPLGTNRIPIRRTLTTQAAAVLVPFTSQEVMHAGGLFYGVNALSKNLIVGDRWAGLAANGFILGTTGSGKSQDAKFEMTQIFLRHPADEILIIDPEREYAAVAAELGGARAVISAGSSDCVNALEIDREAAAEGSDSVREKATYVLGLMETLLGGTVGLSDVKRSIVDRVAIDIYRRFLEGGSRSQPTLATFHEAMAAQPEREAAELATALELYAKGSASGFARQTNIDRDNRVLVYDTAGLSGDLRTFGMMVVLEDIWARIVRNRNRGVRTWVYCDEMHLMASNPHAMEYLQAFWARVRKYGAAMTGMTQDIDLVLASPEMAAMLKNSSYLKLLNQSEAAAASLTMLLGLSARQHEMFTNAAPGTGLMRIAGTTIPFDNQMDTASHIYRVFSTRFGEDKHDIPAYAGLAEPAGELVGAREGH